MLNGVRLAKERLLCMTGSAIEVGCTGLFVGTTAELKTFLQTNWIGAFFFVDTTKYYSGISVPVATGANQARGCVQIYAALSSSLEIACRKLIDGTYYGDW